MALFDLSARPAGEARPVAPTGNLLLWFLIWGELFIFAALIAGFAWQNHLDPQAFAAARLTLPARLAAVNTLVLLLSGWLAALAARPERSAFFRRVQLLSAGALGFVFAVLKTVDYAREIPPGDRVGQGGFFEFFFLLTGFHLAHVVCLAGLLLVFAFKKSRAGTESVVLLWHVTDLVWLALFPLLYLG